MLDFFITNKSTDQALIGLLVGFIVGIILAGVLRNFMKSGIVEAPTEQDFAMLDSKSRKFQKLHNQI